MLIDIHSHHFKKTSYKSLQILDGVHTLGVHPWNLKEPEFQNFKNQFHKKILAIGECGLDRRRKNIASIENQKKILEWHLDWAQEVHLPLIFHCVKAETDFLEILKKKNYKGKILFHDYSGNLKLARDLLKYDTYFSFGFRHFLKSNTSNLLITQLPKNKIFLETDDQDLFSIENIYKQAAFVLGVSLEKLEERLYANFLDFFSDLDQISTTDIVNGLSVS